VSSSETSPNPLSTKSPPLPAKSAHLFLFQPGDHHHPTIIRRATHCSGKADVSHLDSEQTNDLNHRVLELRQGCENWVVFPVSELAKRYLRGEPFHMDAYVDEQVFR
jgi:hypothetical protein